MDSNFKKMCFNTRTKQMELVPVVDVQSINTIEHNEASLIWNITHSFNSTNFFIQVYDANNELVYPDNIETTESSINIYFASEISGICNILFINAEASGGIEPTVTPTVTPTISITPTVTPAVTPTVSPTVTPTITPTVTPVIDPFSANVVSLLHLNGANGSTTITDQIGANSWTANGNAQISTASSKSGSASLLLDGASDWVESTVSGFNFGTGDVCVELWVNQLGPTSGTNNFACNIFDMRDAEPSVALNLYIGGSTAADPADRNKFILYINGAIRIRSTTLSTGGWTHIAIVRSSGVYSMYVNGVSEGGTYANASAFSKTRFALGARFAAISRISSDYRSLYGYIDEFRFTTAARYTGTFTPESTYTNP